MVLLCHRSSGIACYCSTTHPACPSTLASVEETMHCAHFIFPSSPLHLVSFINNFQLVVKSKLNSCHKTNVFSTQKKKKKTLPIPLGATSLFSANKR